MIYELGEARINYVYGCMFGTLRPLRVIGNWHGAEVVLVQNNLLFSNILGTFS